METLLVIITTPLVVWAADRFLFNGDLAAAMVATINEERRRRVRTKRRPARS
jgi:hypothetical protein